MNLLTFKPEPFGTSQASANAESSWGIGSPASFELETPTPSPPLSAAVLARAVASNRNLARQFGWGCVRGGHVEAIAPVLEKFEIKTPPTEEDLARAIAGWQQQVFHRPGDGQLGPASWAKLLADLRANGKLPTPAFKPVSWKVYHDGVELGVIDKTRAYTNYEGVDAHGRHSGVELEFAFRITNMDAVQRAGFVNQDGDPVFRWIQVVELRTLTGDLTNDKERAVQTLRRAGNGFIIDPSRAVERPADMDPHPYYWNETPIDDVLSNLNFSNRPTQNGLCYTEIFFDRPRIYHQAAQPGRRAYFNFETALVGVIDGQRNVLLNTVRWGFDLIRAGANVTIGVNVLTAGPTGGSAAMKHVLSREIADHQFDGHCFVGGGYSRGATCAPPAAAVHPEFEAEWQGFPQSRFEREFEEPVAPKMVRHVDCSQLDRRLPIFRALGTTDPVGVLEIVCQRAVAMLDNVIGEMQRIRGRVAAGETPVPPLVSEILQWSLQTRMLMRSADPRAWTGRGPRTAGQIIRWLANIRKELAGGGLHYVCLNDAICNRFGPETWAVSQPGREFIILCRSFWRAKPGRSAADHAEFQAQTLIHEVSHVYYDTADQGRGPGHAECISQFVADANGGPIDPDFAGFCGGIPPAQH